MISTSLRVCGNCLVGETVPVFRPQMNRWEFGYVERYYVHNHPQQQQQGQDHHSHHQSPPDDYHLIQLSDGREYVRIDEYPYASYIAFYTNKNATTITTTTNKINNSTPSMDHHNHHPHHQGTNPLHSSSQSHHGGTNGVPLGHDVHMNDESMIMVDEVATRQSFSDMTLKSEVSKGFRFSIYRSASLVNNDSKMGSTNSIFSHSFCWDTATIFFPAATAAATTTNTRDKQRVPAY